MRIARPITFIFVMVLALALPHGPSHEVFAQSECVHSLDSVAVEGTWNGDCLSRSREDAYARYYIFSILQQSDVSITLESETDPYLFLLSGTGADADYLSENDDIDTGSHNFHSNITITLEPGDYTIEATTYEQSAVGDFTLTVRGIGPLDDRAALVVLYNATGGDGWHRNDNWLTDAPLDEWHGVATDDTLQIISLDLERNNLSSQIPPQLGNLSNLQYLELGSNNLTGAIPAELGNLTNLISLQLIYSGLTGAIPSDLGNLANLLQLGLDNNDLTGEIPSALGNLENLIDLSLSYNKLTGVIPPKLGNLVNLHHLDLGGNDLTGTIPPELGNLVSLERLYLYDNQLTGEIPSEFGNLTNASDISFSNNRLVGQLPLSLKALVKLDSFFFGNNSGLCAPDDDAFLAWLRSIRYHGGIICGRSQTPDERDISALRALYHATNGDSWRINANWLTDAPLSEWDGIVTNIDGRVIVINLLANNLSGHIPPELGSLSELTHLGLGGNRLTGVVPSELANLSNLEDLHLGANRLTGTIPPELGSLSSLRGLSLYSNQLTGIIPAEIANLSNLDDLSLYGNELTGEIPAELGRLSNLYVLDLSHNHLTGHVPSQLGNLLKLERLKVNDNRLTGGLPQNFIDLTALKTLLYYNNAGLCAPSDEDFQAWLRSVYDLAGDTCGISTADLDRAALIALYDATDGDNWTRKDNWLTEAPLSKWQGVRTDDHGRVQELNLASNNLTGRIPPRLGNIPRLEILNLNDNNLTGRIPSTLGNLVNLRKLELANNQLTGYFPSALGNLGNLELLRVNDNLLRGSLQIGLIRLRVLKEFYYHNNAGLCSSSDDRVQNWLQSIDIVQGPTCDDGPPGPTPEDPTSPIPAGCTLQSFSGTSVDDSWTSNCVSRNRTENGTHYAKFFNFSVSRSATYDITLESRTDPYLILLGESGDIIDDDDDDDDGIFDLRARSSGIRIALEPGDYIVEATTYAGTATGDFTLTIIRPELAALHAFYNATDGENWRQSDNWLTDAPLSQWHGVTTDSDGRVTILELEHNDLSGEVPPEIGEIANLETLNLGGNDLSGELPAELGELEDLATLDLWGNALTGELPPELGNLANLKTLHLLANELTGEIPAELGNLSRLEVLHIGENQLTGAIPPELGSLSNLRTLILFENKLTGEIPPELGELAELNLLWLYTNQLTGEIPPELGDLTELMELHLYENQLVGQIPLELSKLTNLTILHLRDNSLTGEIPPELGNLTKLRYIFLSNNRLTGQIPRELANLSSLIALGLGGNNLTGEIPPKLADIKPLRALWLEDNDLTAQSFLLRLKEIVNLGLLDIGGNQIAGADVLPQIAALTELRELGLQDSQLTTDQLTPHLAALSGLIALYVDDNQLTGEHLLAKLANLSDLHTLDVHNNQLTGTIPQELGTGSGAARKSYLDLSYNQLTGKVPPELVNADELEYLDLSNNQLTHQIPSNLTELEELETFRFHHNAGLCAPNDAEFQEWLQSIDRVEGPTCDDTQPDPDPTPELSECVESLPYEGAVNAIWSTDCTSDIEAPLGRGDRYSKFYTFTLYAESDVSITLTSDEDAFLYLRTGTSAVGAALYENDDYNYPASTDSRIEETLEAGTYTIEATTYAAGVTGDFILTVNGIGPLDDRAVLSTLYNATGGDDWEDNYNWLTDAPLDEWYGVDSDEDRRVIVLDLEGNDLTGHIPPELGELNELESLELGGNLLTGTLPPELGKLIKLTDFSVEENLLTGTIPSEIGDLASLEIVELSGNRFWGELPQNLTALNRLRKFEYEDNSGLCAPADAEFQKWLSSVARVRGDTCVRPDSPPDEREIAALTAIYNATGGDDWFDRTNWFSDEPVQFWSGISVNGEGHITELRLWGNNLSGQIPTEVSHLTSLKHLYLSANQFTRTIPAELGLLTELDHLYLGRNQLTGTIPSALGNLTGLKQLYLSGNQLTGSIPPELGKLVDLESLEIDDNRLTGQLPYELTNLVVLDTLYFNGNDGLCAPGNAAFQDWLKSIAQVGGDTCVSGSEEADRAALTALYNATGGDNWFNNTNWLTDAPLDEWHGVYTDSEGHVVSLYFGHNSLSGALPPEIGGLINLSELGLGSNQLTGTLPPELGNLTRLEFLDLSYNRLWGELPRSMTALTQLISLYSYGNSGLCAPDDAEFQEWLEAIPSGSVWVITCNPPSTRPDAGDLAVLTALYNATDGANWDDNTNWLSERPLQYWKGVTINSEGRVIQLDLFSNQLSGDIPVELGNLADLEWLYLHQNQLSGDIPAELGNLISLERLSLGGNQLSGDIPVTLGGLTYLEVFDLSDNQLRGVIPPELASLTELWTLTLDRNQLSGDVPVELGNLISLKWLSLYNNQLTGDIPATLGRPTYLEMLDLSNNKLTGAIPPELANLTELRSLHLGANQLTGEIPDWLGSLDQLAVLALYDNQLTGAIPPELGSLYQLFYLLLDNNQLTGTIPPELGSLHQLGTLWLHNNRLTGTIPPELSNILYSLEELLLAGNQLEGCIPQVLRGVGTNDLDELGLPFCENADRTALIALYNSTDGDNWFNNTNWLTVAPLSEWHGVSTNSEGRVVTLDLGRNSLSGTVPPEIGELINLRYLGLGSNQLTGTLPPEVGNLTRLEVLNLDDNRLWGPLPDAMAALSVLNRFKFDDNSGLCAPHDPGFQEWLQSIPLLRSGPTCIRTTSPPDGRDIAALTTLYRATSGDNWRDRTNWLSEQPLQYWKGVHINEEGRIVDLRLGENNLSGQIPPELGNLRDLERLELYGNQLTGTIPSELGNLSSLELLSIEYNQLTGSIPAGLSHLIQLTSLRLNSNRLTGAIPSELGSLNNLQILLLDNNKLTGSIPSELGSLSELVVLHLHNNQLTGTIPPELGNPHELHELFLSNNQLTGCIPITLSLVQVTDFVLLGLPFCDNPDRAVLVALYHATDGSNWKNSSNWLTDAPLEEWYGVDTDNKWNVHLLSLSDNRLTGHLPPELGEFYAVKGLYFDNNQLTGQLPSELGNLPRNLVSLRLHSNQFSGAIPSELGNLDKLAVLDVSDNQFTGELPDELTNLRELYSLLFDNNAGLCAPTDADFQQWLQSIDIVAGPTCTGTTPAPTPGNPIPSECVNSLGSTPAEGTWTADCLSINRSENGLHYARYYTFSLDRRTTIELTLESRTDPYLILLDETSNILVQDDDDDEGVFDLTSSSSGIRIVLEAGDYIVEATTYAGTAAGDFTLTFRRAELEALQSLYNFTNGDSWDKSENWLTDAPFAEWYGIQTDDEGRVIGIYLSDNNLKGELPPELGRLSQLKWLGLANNDLSGLIPPELGDLYNLRILVLFNNELTGPIPYQLGKLQELLEMYLEDNRLSGPIPTQLGDLRKLYFLNLTDNELSGDIPSSLGNLQELRDLHIAANDLSGPIPRELGDLINLKRLVIADNDLTGGDFIDLRLDDLDDLSFLDIGGNRIDGRDVLFHVHELFQLRGLGLHDSGLTDSDLRGYMDIIQERNLRFFDISSNELSDPQILEGLSRMSALSYLYIYNNDFSGELPQAMTGLTYMERFHFSGNDGLCAPTNNEFQVWLDSIRDVRGDICPAEVGG